MLANGPTIHVIDKENTNVARADLLFCLCASCTCEINWRHTDASFMLYANCCDLSLRAMPTRPDLAIYLVQCVNADESKNVVRLPVRHKNVLPLKPPDRYG